MDKNCSCGRELAFGEEKIDAEGGRRIAADCPCGILYVREMRPARIEFISMTFHIDSKTKDGLTAFDVSMEPRK